MKQNSRPKKCMWQEIGNRAQPCLDCPNRSTQMLERVRLCTCSHGTPSLDRIKALSFSECVVSAVSYCPGYLSIPVLMNGSDWGAASSEFRNVLRGLWASLWTTTRALESCSSLLELDGGCFLLGWALVFFFFSRCHCVAFDQCCWKIGKAPVLFLVVWKPSPAQNSSSPLSFRILTLNKSIDCCIFFAYVIF